MSYRIRATVRGSSRTTCPQSRFTQPTRLSPAIVSARHDVTAGAVVTHRSRVVSVRAVARATTMLHRRGCGWLTGRRWRSPATTRPCTARGAPGTGSSSPPAPQLRGELAEPRADLADRRLVQLDRSLPALLTHKGQAANAPPGGLPALVRPIHGWAARRDDRSGLQRGDGHYAHARRMARPVRHPPGVKTRSERPHTTPPHRYDARIQAGSPVTQTRRYGTAVYSRASMAWASRSRST